MEEIKKDHVLEFATLKKKLSLSWMHVSCYWGANHKRIDPCPLTKFFVRIVIQHY